jgi:formylglycine-generating enzyme required for sulfatase activity
MIFSHIPAWFFMMGTPTSEQNHQSDESKHMVTFRHDYEMQVTDVTQSQWVAVMGDNPSDFHSQESCPDNHQTAPVDMCPNHPVENVSWNDVQAFIQKFNQTQADGYTYRLPTEAEWEYAARAGYENAYYFGDDASQLAQYAWYNANSSGQTHDVAKLKANDFGLYDMEGNVWQWTQDWYASYPAGEQVDPSGPASGSFRVIRGGAWGSGADYLRSGYRLYWRPENRYYNVGFRLVRTRP